MTWEREATKREFIQSITAVADRADIPGFDSKRTAEGIARIAENLGLEEAFAAAKWEAREMRENRYVDGICTMLQLPDAFLFIGASAKEDVVANAGEPFNYEIIYVLKDLNQQGIKHLIVKGAVSQDNTPLRMHIIADAGQGDITDVQIRHRAGGVNELVEDNKGIIPDQLQETLDSLQTGSDYTRVWGLIKQLTLQAAM